MGRRYNGADYFNGDIDNFSLWDTSLNSEQIATYYSFGLEGDEQNLLAYWSFNEGSGSILNDGTANANHGSISAYDRGYTNLGCTTGIQKITIQMLR